MIDFGQFVRDFAMGIKLADQKKPIAVNARRGIPFQAGIGPHSENDTLKLVMDELHQSPPGKYADFSMNVRYPLNLQKKCDLCLGKHPNWDWAVELKMLRLFGDNGRANDNMLMHILSPYPAHRSALTDCEKLIGSGLMGRKAILIYGFEDARFPLEPAIRAFELLAADRVELGPRIQTEFDDLIHPVHRKGAVFAWEIVRARNP